LPSGSEIAVSSISLYNYPFNISSAMGNNQIVVIYPYFSVANINALNLSGVVASNSYTDSLSGRVINQTNVQITMPDGYYDVPSFNNYLQNIFLLIKFYFLQTNTDGSIQEEVFITCQTNPTQYKCQFNFYPVLHTLTTGLSLPSNTFAPPPINACPQVYFPQNNSPYGSIGNIFGFSGGTLLGGGSSSISYLSTTYPVVNPISTILFTCNLVYNDICIPNNLLTQFPIQGQYGSMMTQQSHPTFISCLEIKSNYIEIQLFDNYLQPLQIVDPEFSISLLIKVPIIKPTR